MGGEKDGGDHSKTKRIKRERTWSRKKPPWSRIACRPAGEQREVPSRVGKKSGKPSNAMPRRDGVSKGNEVPSSGTDETMLGESRKHVKKKPPREGEE